MKTCKLGFQNITVFREKQNVTFTVINVMLIGRHGVFFVVVQDRLLTLERKDQENRLMQKYLDKLCGEDMEKLQRRRAEQHRLYEELNSCNSDLLFRKEYAKEQERVLDQKVLAYQKAKAVSVLTHI